MTVYVDSLSIGTFEFRPTNSIREIGAQSLSLNPNLIILVYPPSLFEYIGAILSNNS